MRRNHLNSAIRVRFVTKTWSLLAVLAMSGIVVILHIIELPAVSSAGQRLVDATHAPGFGLAALVALLFFRQRARPLIAYMMTLSFVFVLALGSEAVQVFGPRNADLTDFGRGMLGAVGFLALVASSDPKLLPVLGRGKWAVLVAGVAATVTAVAPLAQSVRVLNARSSAMPVIASFDETWEQSIYKALGPATLTTRPGPRDWPAGEGNVLAAELAPVQYSGLSIEPYPDWSGYEVLTFLAASADGKAHAMTIRIHDATHNWEHEDRFNTRITVEPEPRRYEISLTNIQSAVSAREFDLNRVADITLFKVNAEEGDRILVDDFRLR